MLNFYCTSYNIFIKGLIILLSKVIMETYSGIVPFYCEFAHLVNQWPAPVKLTNAAGDTFVTMQKLSNCIEAQWAGHITADDVVTAAKLFAKLLQKTPCTALLNDKGNVTGDWTEANDWLEFEWLPQVMQAGLQCLAHIYSDNMFSRLSARDLQQRFVPTLQMQNFNDRTHAERWLEECMIQITLNQASGSTTIV